ncbi:FkbM family methyltransferase [Cyanobium sp. Copco_Reservoir_LC18]|uniref:FkbM family methyltransferase n=1 Tax=Cyanobium sp. Copco_Reservoir_LC18 TaxID=1328305 RepID=UPI00135A569A|nr:FkbM family methyltransferase [Cyanobium sp. Copco_Reservoir_LC18]
MAPSAWISNLSGAVIHVGAHFAEEASAYHDLRLSVLWIEACPAFARQLAHAIDAYEQQDFRIAALSDRYGDVRRFYLSSNSDGASSSLKDFGPDANRIWPTLGLHHVSDLPVVTTTLDHLMSAEAAWVAENQPTTLILDVQGSELEVLQGATGSLWRFDTIIIEVSSVNVYQDATSEQPVHNILTAIGFERKDYSAHVEGHGDALYVRASATAHDFDFERDAYLEINEARWKHVAGHALIQSDHSVLELGSGPGWFTQKLLETGCLVTSVDGRPENIRAINQTLSSEERRRWIGYTYDANQMISPAGLHYDCVFAYGVLYHLSAPERFLRMLRSVEPSLVILETCVTPDPLTDADAVNLVPEPASVGSQSTTGVGCRPSRLLIWNQLQALFPHVYSFHTTVEHPQFPDDWTLPRQEDYSEFTRMLFVGSAEPFSDPALVPHLVLKHEKMRV